jgi:hypothetical protein
VKLVKAPKKSLYIEAKEVFEKSTQGEWGVIRAAPGNFAFIVGAKLPPVNGLAHGICVCTIPHGSGNDSFPEEQKGYDAEFIVFVHNNFDKILEALKNVVGE